MGTDHREARNLTRAFRTEPEPKRVKTLGAMRSRATTMLQSGDAMFSNKTGAPGRPEALEQFKRVVDNAVNEARHHYVDVRVLAEQLDQRADALRVWFATTAPTGHAL
jgi:hypothetical protein